MTRVEITEGWDGKTIRTSPVLESDGDADKWITKFGKKFTAAFTKVWTVSCVDDEKGKRRIVDFGSHSYFARVMEV